MISNILFTSVALFGFNITYTSYLTQDAICNLYVSRCCIGKTQRNPVNSRQKAGLVKDPGNHTMPSATVASNSKPQTLPQSNTFVWPQRYLLHSTLMVLVGMDWGQSVGTESGWRQEWSASGSSGRQSAALPQRHQRSSASETTPSCPHV